MKLVEKGNKTNKKRWRGYGAYYYITPCGDVTYSFDSMCLYDEQCYKLGNYFKTKEEAEFARKKRLIYQQLKDYALGHNTEEIDWNNLSQFRWFIKYDNNCEIIRYCWTRFLNCMNQIYFTSEEIARAAVEEIGEDNIKKYLFGGKE